MTPDEVAEIYALSSRIHDLLCEQFGEEQAVDIFSAMAMQVARMGVALSRQRPKSLEFCAGILEAAARDVRKANQKDVVH